MIRSLCAVITLILVGLKLAGLIDWEWGWVIFPILLYTAGFVALAVFYLVSAFFSDNDDNSNITKGRK